MQRLASFIGRLIDVIYRPFRSVFPRQLFRYGICGGGNLVLDWVLYYIVYHFIAQPLCSEDSVIHIFSFFALTPHIFSLCIVFPITLFTGFWLNRNITFTGSSLRGRKQLVRYILIVCINLAVNYIGLKLCVDMLGWYPTPSKMLITLLTVVISFLGQKYYSFRH